MKFFTRGWVHGDMTDAESDAVLLAYVAYMDSLNLPESLQKLNSVDAHDAYILHVAHDAAAQSLLLLLRGGYLQVGYWDIELKFSGATINDDHYQRLVEAAHPPEFEILYTEIDRSSNKMFEYRLLLHPVGEISIRFTDVAIDRRPVANRLDGIASR
jgi:hypothetical protein